MRGVSLRSFVNEALNVSTSRYFSFVQTVLVFVTIVSLVELASEGVQLGYPYAGFLVLVSWCTGGFFLTEYLLRVWVADKRWKYVGSFYGILDLVTILPVVLGFGNFAFLKIARLTRVVYIVSVANISQVHTKTEEIATYYGVRGSTIVWVILSLLPVLCALFYLKYTSMLSEVNHVLALRDTLAMYTGFRGLPVAIGAYGTSIFVVGKVVGYFGLGFGIGSVERMVRTHM